jgi:hypothetical protein
MTKLEEAIVIALKEMKECSDMEEGMLRYRYVQNWFTNVLVKCEPETNVYEFYKRLES